MNTSFNLMMSSIYQEEVQTMTRNDQFYKTFRSQERESIVLSNLEVLLQQNFYYPIRIEWEVDENGEYILTPIFFPRIDCASRKVDFEIFDEDKFLDNYLKNLSPESEITPKEYAVSRYEKKREGEISDLRRQNRKLMHEKIKLRKMVQQLKSSQGRKLKPEGWVIKKFLGAPDLSVVERYERFDAFDYNTRYVQLQFLVNLQQRVALFNHRHRMVVVLNEFQHYLSYKEHITAVPNQDGICKKPCRLGGFRIKAWVDEQLLQVVVHNLRAMYQAFPDIDSIVKDVKICCALLHLRPEGDVIESEKDVHEFLQELYDMQEFKERSDAIINSVSNTTSLFGNCVSLSIKIFGALTALSTAETKEELLKIAIGILSQQISPEAVDQLTRVLNEKLVEPEGMLDNISNIRNGINSLKTSVAALDSIPGYKMLKEFFTIILFFGLKPSDMTTDGTISAVLQAVEQSVDVSGLDVMMSCMNISERLLEIFEVYLGGGDVKNFLAPQTLFSKVSMLDNRYKYIKLGSYKDVYENRVEDYVAELNRTIAEVTTELKKGKLHPTTRTIYVGYENKLRKIAEDIKARSQSFQLRLKPHCVVIYGPSDVGKTTVLNQIIAAAGKALNIDVSLKRRWYANENDDYDSDHRQDMTTGIWDDAGNAKNDGTQPKYHIGSRLIKLVNNIPAYSIQAEADKKGQIQYKFDIIALTTNVLELGAYSTSNEPYSILRRGDFIEVRVKAQFQSRVAAGKLDPENALVYENGIQVPLHELRIFRWVEDANGKINQLTLLPFSCISVAIPFLCEKWKKEREQQRDYVKTENKAHLIPRCDKCYQPRTPAWCHCEGVEHVTEEEMMEFWNKDLAPESNVVSQYLMNATFSSICSYFLRIPVPRLISNCVRPCYIDVTEQALSVVHNLPDLEVLSTGICLTGMSFSVDLRLLIAGVVLGSFCLFSNKIFLSSKTRLMNVLCLTSLILIERLSGSFMIMMLSVLMYLVFIMINLAVFTRDVFQMELERRIRAGGDYLDVRTLPFIRYGLMTVTALSGIVMMKKMWNSLKPVMIAQSDLLPQNNEEILQRHQKKNDWIKVEPARLAAPVFVKSMTYEQMKRRIRPHLLRFVLDNDKVRVRGMGIAINTSLILVPLHSLGKHASIGDQLEYDTNPNCLSTKGVANIVKMHNIPYRDFTIVQIDKQLPVSDRFLDFVSDEYLDQPIFCNMITLRDDIVEQKVLYKFNRNVDNGAFEGPGSIHSVQQPTEVGDCMAPIVSMTNPHVIVGFHCGGNGSNLAACFTLLRSEIQKGIDHFRVVLPEGRITAVKVEEWDDYRYPVSFVGIRNKNTMDDNPIYNLSEEPHERAVVNYINSSDDGLVKADCAYFGFDESARYKPRSSVHITEYSKYLENNGWPRLHGKPDFRYDRNHATYFQIGVRGLTTIDKRLLERAMSDYVNPILQAFVDTGYKPAVNRVLTLHEALNGHPKTMWIKQIDEKTSAGCGLPKKKENHLEITFTEEGRKVLWAKEYIISEVEEMYDTLSRGELVSPIVRTSLKDEPTKRAADGALSKVRAFAVFPMSFFLLGKMLFAPILASLYDFPLVTEMLQGVNCTTRQWDEIKRYILDFSPDMALEGDYSKFDAHLSGQLMRAAGSILVSIGRFLGYSSTELLAAHTYVCDVSMNPWMFAGSAIVLDKMNPSGNYLTIAINGICNALLHRCAWYSLKPDNLEGTFRDYVRLGTVGDDSIATTKNNWFNMKELQGYFSTINMPYTDGRKSTIVPRFFHASEVILCKRSFRYEPRVDCFVAPLSIESIGRALHCKKKCYLDELTLTAQCIIAQLRELARHDEETFLHYREILKRSAEDYGIGDLILELTYSYDEWWNILAKDFSDTIDSPSTSESSLTTEYDEEGDVDEV